MVVCECVVMCGRVRTSLVNKPQQLTLTRGSFAAHKLQFTRQVIRQKPTQSPWGASSSGSAAASSSVSTEASFMWCGQTKNAHSKILLFHVFIFISCLVGTMLSRKLCCVCVVVLSPRDAAERRLSASRALFRRKGRECL